jgi:L-lactate dehydrogenase complex protein LldE
VVGLDMSCLMNIEGRLRRRGHSVEVRHLAEVLAAGWRA